MYKEKKRLGEKDLESEKIFASCVKQLEEKSKKTSQLSTSRPFRPKPGGNPGSAGDVLGRIVILKTNHPIS